MLSLIIAPCVGGLLVAETRTMTSVKPIGERTSHVGIDDLLGMAIEITSNEKSIDENISPGKTNDYDE